ncbi:MAG: preprotein translocase subunit YajC [Propionibacteriaceae bacterium]|nr:preprotein translocase subunit YajC [Propionibacteriaceae bacterium]
MPADNSMLSTLLMFAVMGLAFWLLLIRPAQRKQKAQQELVSQLGPGSRVMTTAGVLATVREMGEKTAVVEISPGVEMTILRQAIMRAVDPSEDEFEYDEDAEVEATDIVEEDSTAVFDPERPVDPDQKSY